MVEKFTPVLSSELPLVQYQSRPAISLSLLANEQDGLCARLEEVESEASSGCGRARRRDRRAESGCLLPFKAVVADIVEHKAEGVAQEGRPM